MHPPPDRSALFSPPDQAKAPAEPSPTVQAASPPPKAARPPSEMRKPTLFSQPLRASCQDFSFYFSRQTKAPARPRREALGRRQDEPPSDAQRNSTAGPSWTGRTRFFFRTGSRALPISTTRY